MNRQLYVVIFGLILLFSLTVKAEPSVVLFIPGQSVAGIELGVSDTILTQKQAISLKLSLSGKDTEYEGQTVYYYYFGNQDAQNNYPLQVYSDVNHKIFIFEINSPLFATKEGLKVGSLEAELLKVYGDKLKKQKRGKIYIKYSLGDKKGTDFYVKEGKVTQILVRAYSL